jgi:hypothetical protein
MVESNCTSAAPYYCPFSIYQLLTAPFPHTGLLMTIAEKVALRRAIELRDGKVANALQKPKVVVRCVEECVPEGKSTSIDLLHEQLGDDGDDVFTVKVAWLYSILFHGHSIQNGGWALIKHKGWSRPEGAFVQLFDMFAIDEQVYLHVRSFSSFTNRDDDGTLWAYDSDLQPCNFEWEACWPLSEVSMKTVILLSQQISRANLLPYSVIRMGRMVALREWAETL